MGDTSVAVYGAGQLGTTVAAILRERRGYDVTGPCARDARDEALRSGADVVVMATTSFFAEVAPDIRDAVRAGSNVITSAEECAYPWAVDAPLADDLDALAREKEVTILGCGLNPGFAFDALVVTVLGGARDVARIRVERVVDLSAFSETVLRRLGLGFDSEEFARRKKAGTIYGHIGFPQSMRIVAARLGLEIERIDAHIDPIIGDRRHQAANLTVEAGESAGFEQRYTASVEGETWFECLFTGHVSLESIGLAPRDEIDVEGATPLHFVIDPGLNPQRGSSAVMANSVRRVAAAPPGWRTVAELPAAIPV
jgi:4-hydroxy-tetrahydrodipicolinate reductase